MNPFESLVTSITKRSADKIEKEIPILTLSGMGGSMKDSVINFETLVFTVNKTINKDQGVGIISDILKIYLREVALEKKMESYVKKHPFTYKNLKIKLFVHDEKGEMVYHPNIGFFTLSDGMISFRTVNRSDNGYFKKVLDVKEPYEEAARRLGVWHGQ